jgi:predicted membrane-bound spermidine synthase
VRRPGLTLAYVLFFASGFAALVYQIVWQRLLVLFSGSDVHSASIIVAAFMTGLGSVAAHRSRNPSRAFLMAQVAIGV